MGAELNDASAGPPPADTPLGTAGLPALVEALRAEGYRAGAAETVAAGRLLTQLARRGFVPARARDLAPWLRPVFCTTREEQARFTAIFDPWADGFDARAAAERAQRASQAGDAPGAKGGGTQPDPVGPTDRWVRRVLTALMVMAVVAGLGWSAWNAWRTSEQPPAPAATPSASAPGLTGAASAPAAPAVVSAPAVRQPDLQGYFPALRESRSLWPGIVWPALLLPLLLLLLGGGLPGLALMQGRRRSAREVVLDTAPLAREAQQVLPELDAAVASRLERHVRAEGDDGGPLARRRRLDARRTVEATLRNHGILSPRYRAVPVRPSYLLLIDAQDEHDPRGRLFHLWAERLRRGGLVVDIRLFRRGAEASDTATPPDTPVPAGTDAIGAVASSPRCWRAGQQAEHDGGMAIDRLEDPPAGQRLIAISEASAWLHADGHWRDWFRRARLRRWPQRVFFTPTEVRDWGLLEERLEAQEHAADPGVLVLPLDESALDAWSVMLSAGSMPAFALAEPQRYPRLLASASFDAFSQPQRPQLDRLIAQLKLYLGDSGFRWLAALAVPPLSRWELTLLLGQALFDHRATHGVRAAPMAAPGGTDSATTSPTPDTPGTTVDPLDSIAEGGNESWRAILGRCYRRLARLPWLRGGHDARGGYHAPGLPEWLRLRLLDELPPAAQEEVREIVGRLLSTLRPDGGEGVALGFEAPSSARAGAAAQADGSPQADHLYLGYLSGLTPRQLAMRLPGGWREWLRNQPLPEPGWLARLRRMGGLGGEWLAAAWARLRFRDGMPWAEATKLPLAAGVAILGVGFMAWRFAAQPADALAPGIEGLLFEREMREVLPPTGQDVLTVALSPNGDLAVDVDVKGAVRVWETATGRTRLRIDDAQALSARFGTTSFVLTCDARGELRRWAADGGAVDPERGGEASFTGCAIGPEGTGRAMFVDVPKDVIEVHSDGQAPVRITNRDAFTAMLSHNGEWLVSQLKRQAQGGGTYDAYRVASLNGEAAAKDLVLGGPVAWAGDKLLRADRLVENTASALFRLDNLARADTTSVEFPLLGPPDKATALAMSADARYAVVGTVRGELELWDLQSNLLVASRTQGGSPIEHLLISDDGSAVISQTREGPIRLWRAWQPALATVGGPVDQVAVSGDGRRAAFAQTDGTVVVRGEGSEPVTLQGPAAPELIAFSADGQRLAVAGAANAATFWPSIGALVSPLTLIMDAPLAHLAFTGDGLRLVGVSQFGSITEWRASDGQMLGTWRGQGSGLRQLVSATMRPDGLVAMLMVLPGGEGERVVVLRTATAALREMPAASSWSEMRLKFLDDGNQLAVTERVGSGVWNVATGAYTTHRSAPPTRSTGMSPSRDDDLDGLGVLRATVGANGRLTVWNVNDGVAVKLPDGPIGQDVRKVRWLPRQRLLVVNASGAASVLPMSRSSDAAQAWALASEASATVPLALGAAPTRLATSADGGRIVATPYSAQAEVASANVLSKPSEPLPTVAAAETANAPVAQTNAVAPSAKRARAQQKAAPGGRDTRDTRETSAAAPAPQAAEPAASAASADAASPAMAGWWPLVDAAAPKAPAAGLTPTLAWPVVWSVLALLIVAIPGVLMLESAQRRRQRQRLGELPAGGLWARAIEAARQGRQWAGASAGGVS